MNRFKVFLGSLGNHVPYSLAPRIGKVYNGYRRDIRDYNASADKREWIFKRVYATVDYAIHNIPFYQKFYADKGFDLSQLRSFDDIRLIPILTKKDLMNTDLAQRTVPVPGCFTVNTGGSSGTPLSFLKTYNLRIKEMAFYHDAWARLGYKKYMLRLQFAGRHDKPGLTYEFSRNEIRVSIYEPYGNILSQIKGYDICFLQGYPSVIYEFALYCEQHDDEFKQSSLKRCLKGVLLNSEYPLPVYRSKIEQVFGVPSVASFGHTEGGALGFDYGDGVFLTRQAYGYAESVEMGGTQHLVATTYDNLASPFIRYDTDDIMDRVDEVDGILQSFDMSSGGRSGQYLEDAKGNRVSLTGLIFGKHHALFNYCSQLQISQNVKGEAVVYYVPITKLPKDFNPAEHFDADDVDMTFSFVSIPEPIRTKAGKVLLKVDV